MGGLQWALSWLVVRAVGLARMLVLLGDRGVIGQAFRRKYGGPRTGSRLVKTGGEEERHDRREAAPPG
jgi:hypothetical protein